MRKTGKLLCWDVYLNGKEIDKIFHADTGETFTEQAEDVRLSLVNHDGYDSGIVVRRSIRRPFLPRYPHRSHSKAYEVTDWNNHVILVTEKDVGRARIFAQFNEELANVLSVLESLNPEEEVKLTNNDRSFVWKRIR